MLEKPVDNECRSNGWDINMNLARDGDNDDKGTWWDIYDIGADTVVSFQPVEENVAHPSRSRTVQVTDKIGNCGHAGK